MSIRCPNCGTVFGTEHESDLHYMQSHIFLNGEPVTRVTSDTLTIQENETMPTVRVNNNGTETVRTTSNNTGVNTMENINTIDMNAFADLVAQRVKANVTSASRAKQTADGGNFALTSKYYGKEICGQMYSPFLVPRFLEKQYKAMMTNYESIYDAVKGEVSYMDSIYFMIEECHRLSYMDKISFEERKKFWSVDDVKKIFKDYFDHLKFFVEQEKSKVITRIHKKNRKVDYFKFMGTNYPAEIKYVSGKRDNGSVYSKATLSVKWDLDKFIDDSLRTIGSLNSYGDIYKYMELSRKKLIKLESQFVKTYKGNGKYGIKYNSKGFVLTREFVEGYLKKGAFYTIANMVRFSHANVYEYKGNNRILNGREAIDYLRSRLDAGDEAYRFHALLKRTMNISR